MYRLNPTRVLDFLLQEERRGSTLLLVAALAALVSANSRWSQTYFHFFDSHLKLGVLTLDIRQWIDDGLMALFFLVVGLEIKRELIDGELRTLRHALFPLIAAIGGMLAPAFIFSFMNPHPPQANGWAVPMATDIALAVGVLALLGRRVPRSLRVFLLSLAIADDIGSIAVISLFYSRPTNTFALLVAVVLSLGLLLIRRQRYWLPGFVLIGAAIVYCLLLAGVSGTLGGIVLAAAMPIAGHRRSAKRLQTAEVVEDILLPAVSFLVVPLFVLANAGLRLADVSFRGNASLPVFTGVTLGLVLGKPVGIVLAGWLATTLRLAHKPRGVTWHQLAGAGCLAGIGFTVSLLVSGLAYSGYSALRHAAVAGIFTASAVSAILGLTLLHRTPGRQRR